MKEWGEASDMQQAVKSAGAAAREFDGLYTESAQNILARTPELLLLLSAYIAGRQDGYEQGKKEAVEQFNGAQGVLHG